MPVCVLSKTWDSLQRKQLQQTHERHHVASQRENVLQHSRLPSELRRQIRFQGEKRRVLTATFLPIIPSVDSKGFSQRRMHFKQVKNRISSASDCQPSKVLCSRRVMMEDVHLARHFCELLGPRLCVDCIRERERVESLKENEETPTSFHLEREPFTALVSSHLHKQQELEEVSESFDDESLNQDSDLDDIMSITQSRAVSKVTVIPTPPGTGDSGYSSRLSRIRGLTRANSCSVIRNFVPFSPLRREKTHAPRLKHSWDTKTTSGHSSPVSREMSREDSDSYGFLSTIQRLHERRELGRSEMDVTRAWAKTPVEPILMELKLINFTQYTDLGYHPPPPEPEPEPDIKYDEFGFPMMESVTIPTGS